MILILPILYKVDILNESIFACSCPIIVNILEDSNDIDELFEVALEVRDEYQKLRSWINEFQVAIEFDEPKQISKYSDILQSVDKHIKTKYSQDKYGALSLDLDLWTFTPGISNDILINSMLINLGYVLH